MPGEWHDDFVRLIKTRPKLSTTILREVMGVDLPRNSSVRLGSDTYNTRPSDDLVPGITVVVGPDDEPLRVVIVEVQSEKLASKRRQIPRYVMGQRR